MQRDTFKKLIAFPLGTEEKVANYAEEHNLNFTEAALEIIENATAEENNETYTWVSDHGYADFIATPAQHELLTVCKAHSGAGNQTSASAIMQDLGKRTTAAKIYERLDEFRGYVVVKNLGSGRLEIIMMTTLKK